MKEGVNMNFLEKIFHFPLKKEKNIDKDNEAKTI